MSPKPRHSLGQGDTWESGIATVTEKEVCIFFMQLDQLWLCLIGVELSIHHYSTLDKEMLLSWMLETFSQLSKLQGQDHWKIGSGESVTWLVSNCDATAGLLPLRYIFYLTKIICMYYKGIIIRQVRSLKSRYMHHFIIICEFKLELQSGNR